MVNLKSHGKSKSRVNKNMKYTVEGKINIFMKLTLCIFVDCHFSWKQGQAPQGSVHGIKTVQI